MATAPQPPAALDCRVNEVTLMGEDVYRVRLDPVEGELPAFAAGQYLALELPGEEPAWFSIASAPGEAHLTLHIQVAGASDTAAQIIDHLRQERQVRVNMPFGEACLTAPPSQPLLLVVAGTGFAQAKSVVEFLMAQPASPPVFLYWGVRRHEDMYLRTLADQWQQRWPDFHFRPVVGDDADHGWTGHHDHLVRALKADGHRLGEVQVLASGSPAMVYSVMDTLVDAGLPQSHFLSDVLQYAPRG
ncbi:MAG: CDP-6-deoxy-delta-3,4-glucoseen reductase [Oleiphilaceae bacterium]|nr:CDP-6-deoxy-delta-3,4-glucoseen reductase [Oleiphilaceae bacterium]